MLLALRMIVYSLAVPVAAYVNGTFDPDTGVLTIQLDNLIETLGLGTSAIVGTFITGRVSKRNGGLS